MVVALAAVACGGQSSPSTTSESTATTVASVDGVVTLTASTTTWDTYQYELTQFGTIVPGSYDGQTRTQRTLDAWVLENQFLEVTLLPEFGGRILSIVYKPTGHEQLYQNPVGADATGLELTYLVTLTSGRTAVDAEVVIENPGRETVAFEYWTNATLAPGSEPGDTRATLDGTAIADGEVTVDPAGAASISAALPEPGTGSLRLELTDAAGSVVFDATEELDDA